MYHLSKTPLFLEFLKRSINLSEEKEQFAKKIENELFLHSQCACGQQDCATVLLKRKKPWKKEDVDCLEEPMDKGYITFHFLENGFLELEAIRYNNFPYKQEIDGFFKTNRKSSKSYPIKRPAIKRITIKQKHMLNSFFSKKDRVSFYDKNFKIKSRHKVVNQ